MMRRLVLVALTASLLAACGDDEPKAPPEPSVSPGARATAAPTPTSTAPAGRSPSASPAAVGRRTGITVTSSTATGSVRLEVREVATGLDTPWELAWDPQGRLWFTERPGRLTRLGAAPIRIPGVDEVGESGLTGLEFDDRGRIYVLHSTTRDNRVVRLRPDGTRGMALVTGIARAAIHNGGPIVRGPDGTLYVSTGDAGEPSRAQDDGELAGKVLALDPDTGRTTVFSKGHRNAQGLCFAPDGRFLSTEHGPDRGDEVNVLRRGFNGGWPDQVGNGIRNYTPTIAVAGCSVYSAGLIPQWRGSMLFVTLKGSDLRRLTFDSSGRVTDEEVLLDERFGRLRDVKVGPDGAVYFTTSNRDGRGDPARTDDRILRLAPPGR